MTRVQRQAGCDCARANAVYADVDATEPLDAQHVTVGDPADPVVELGNATASGVCTARDDRSLSRVTEPRGTSIRS